MRPPWDYRCLPLHLDTLVKYDVIQASLQLTVVELHYLPSAHIEGGHHQCPAEVRFLAYQADKGEEKWATRRQANGTALKPATPFGLGRIHTHLQIMLLATCCRAGAPNFMAMMKENSMGEGNIRRCKQIWHCRIYTQVVAVSAGTEQDFDFMSQISLPQKGTKDIPLSGMIKNAFSPRAQEAEAARSRCEFKVSLV